MPRVPLRHQREQGEGNDSGDPLAGLADALLTLSPADREKLAAMLYKGLGTGGRV